MCRNHADLFEWLVCAMHPRFASDLHGGQCRPILQCQRYLGIDHVHWKHAVLSKWRLRCLCEPVYGHLCRLSHGSNLLIER